MALFAMGDVHLSLGADKPMDIFKGWENYVEKIEKNWRAVVGQEDTVIINGDISWALKLQDTLQDLAFLNALPGRKLLIKGNHDLWWTTMKKMKQFLQDNAFTTLDFIYNNAAVYGNVAICGTRGWFFDDTGDKKVLLREAGRLELSLQAARETGKEPVVFLHYPPLAEDQICHEIMDVLIHYQVKRCFYGHLHGAAGYRARRAQYAEFNFGWLPAIPMIFVLY